MYYMSKLKKFKLNTYNPIELLFFYRIKFVDPIFKPFDTLAAKFFRGII